MDLLSPGTLRPAPIGGGGSVPAYEIVPFSGAINDAGAFTTTGTGVAGDGTATWVMVGDITQIDGAQENWAGWTHGLTALYPDWSDTTDRLDLCLEIAAMPLLTSKYGFWFGVMDNTYANRATALSSGLTVYPNSTTVTQTSQVGATANSSATNNGTNTNVVSQVFASITWDSGGVPRVIGRTKRTTDEGEITISGTPIAAMATASSRHIVLGHYHVSTTTGTPTLSARLYARRVRATAPFV